ncbi:hypothetical protein GPECTOR_9g744 [Gonium pectorale]|uniref:Prolyl 4-hydroxylase alpha subunit Fe(2+) 2OG dioxygenase domain-containing protein n=1 Tax=Gonium pectorale TaxID=33097 RepID=A0A150GSM9_GONPE|nr:hypothetical protein GPECTOR_9g744 [Gonium pectorale]|eukprot:KXZ52698.1 hypothetical protein GPECTOR_9g744 [Gonium pectorale]
MFSSLRLRRLLLYEPGGHFRPHRDAELEPGVYGTLVVQLPVAGGHTGGELLIGRSEEIRQWRTEVNSNTPYGTPAAYFSACERQLSPITSGLRAVLVFSLVRDPGFPLPRPPPCMAAAHGALAAAVRAWEASAAVAVASAPGTVAGSLVRHSLRAIPLQNKYSTTGLSFGALYGRDAQVASLLCGCPDLDVHLAMVTKKGRLTVFRRERRRRTRGYYRCACGCCAYSDDDEPLSDEYSSDDGYYNEDDEDLELEWSHSTSQWASRSGPLEDFAGCAIGLHAVPLGDDDLFEDADGDLPEPDESRTELVTFPRPAMVVHRSHHKAVVVLWPRSRRAVVAEAAGFRATLRLMEVRLAERAAELAAAARWAPAVQGSPSPPTLPTGRLPPLAEPHPPQAVDTALERDMPSEELAEVLIRAAAAHGSDRDLLQSLLPEAARQQAPDAGGVVRALQLLTSQPFLAALAASNAVAAACGAGAGGGAFASPSAAARLVATLPTSLVLGPVDTTNAVVRASGRLREAAFDKAVAMHAASQARSGAHGLDRCLALAFAATTPPGLRHRVAERLLERLTEAGVLCGLPAPYVPLAARLACDGPPELLRHLPCLAEAALLRSDSGELVWAVLREEAVERAVSRGDPNAAELVSALMARMLSSRPGGGSDGGGGIATLDAGGVKAAAQLVCSGPPCVRQHQAAFASGVLARPDTQALLPALLALPDVSAAVCRREPGALALVEAAAASLERVLAQGPPALSWEQPMAQMPQYPQIEAFLRGPLREATFHGMWSGMPEARRWADAFNQAAGRCGFDASATPCGRGLHSYCVIVKGLAVHNMRLQAFHRRGTALQGVRAMVARPPGTAAGGAAATAAAAGGSGQLAAPAAAVTAAVQLTGAPMGPAGAAMVVPTPQGALAGLSTPWPEAGAAALSLHSLPVGFTVLQPVAQAGPGWQPR